MTNDMKVYKPTAEEQERARNFTNTDSFDCPKMTKEDLKNCVCFFFRFRVYYK